MLKTIRHVTFFVLATALCATPAMAGTIAWDFTGSNSSGSFGNTRTFTSGGITITATAWGFTWGSGNTALESAALGQWSTGLGVCDRAEGSGCSDPSHQVDNEGYDNFVLFQFSAPVDITTVTIDPYGTWDRDVSYWAGNVVGTLNLDGKTYANLAALGFGSRVDDDGTTSSSSRNVAISGGAVNALLFGAQVGGQDPTSYTYNCGSYQHPRTCTGTDYSYDYFKISGLNATTVPPPDTNPVPEPGTVVLLGTGVAALAVRYRRARA